MMRALTVEEVGEAFMQSIYKVCKRGHSINTSHTRGRSVSKCHKNILMSLKLNQQYRQFALQTFFSQMYFKILGERVGSVQFVYFSGSNSASISAFFLLFFRISEIFKFKNQVSFGNLWFKMKFQHQWTSFFTSILTVESVIQ